MERRCAIICIPPVHSFLKLRLRRTRGFVELPGMNRKPGIGEANLGAVAGTVTGAIGGLLAVGLPLAIHGRDTTMLVNYRTLAVTGFLICVPLGWLLGGQIGPRCVRVFGDRHGEMIGGILGGLLPVSFIMAWAISKILG
jgi:hypothetical protein